MRKIVDGNKACADVAYVFSEVASIYPITPSSTMASEVDILSNKGEKNLFDDKVKVIEMQSEAGAAGCMHGSLLAGSLSTTFTASQGLLLMIPNMYKMAGECLPGVIHVAARTVATHALSIFGDHSDIYAVRQTGFCMLASSNVEDASKLSVVAHLSAIKGSLPFLHFFDGFRTSHEVNTIDSLSRDDLISLIDYEKIKEFKARALNVNSNIQKGMAENEDIYFQSVEARNELYNAMPDIVNEYMMEINKLTGSYYKPFNYYGDPKATSIIIAMGSVCDTIKLVVDDLNSSGEHVGLIEVHLYRPFSKEYLLNVLPDTVKRIAVLDRTKEPGSVGEPLYLDVCGVLKTRDLTIVGGRYGLSSKNTTPDQIYAVYKMLDSKVVDNFTIGIEDDVTNLSLNILPYHLKLNCKEIKIYGYGSDGMVSTSKDILHLLGENRDTYVQGYNEYDSKKSGGVTICNLRISDKKIRAPFYVTEPDILVITKDEYLFKFDMVDELKDNGILLISTNKKDMDAFLPNKVKRLIVNKNIKLYTVDAEDIAIRSGIKGKISKIIETIILYLMDYNNPIDAVSRSIEEMFSTKGEDIIKGNKLAIVYGMDNLKLFDGLLNFKDEEEKNSRDVIDMISNRRGGELKVSELIKYRDGTFSCSLSRNEKRHISTFVPKWNKEACIECGLCSLVCPHAVIRPFTTEDEGVGIPFIGKDGINYVIKVSEADCTSCGLCINVCPGKNGEKALSFGHYDEKEAEISAAWFKNHKNPEGLVNKYTIKGSQLCEPKFEFSGSCAGCGETPYIKLLTQLMGDKLVIANATGCSSIYGGSVPSTPYSIPWANSLFEDNAEFGYGMLMSYEVSRDRIKRLMESTINNVSDDIKELYNLWLDNINDFEITLDIKHKLMNKNINRELRDLIDYIPARSVWAIGGDGWAYDIGFGGIDHVLSSNSNINILVLDTEVYSNTGGQASKSSRYGAVAQFADSGKRTRKKDLFRIAMSYPNCYVANISLGANPMQSIKAFKEAEEHDGPSIIIAYSPCIEQGIKGGMCNANREEKLVVESGYLILMRYNPDLDKLVIDSKEPNFELYDELLKNEVRYNSLYKKNPEAAYALLETNKLEAMERYKYYQSLVKEDK